MSKKASSKNASNNKLTNKNLNTIKVICSSVLIIILLYYIIKYIASITVSNNIPTIEHFASYTGEPLLSISPTKNLITENVNTQSLNKDYSIMTVSSNAKSDKMYCINISTKDRFKSLCKIEQTQTQAQTSSNNNNNNINIVCKYAESGPVLNKDNYTLNNPEITQQYTISDSNLPPCTNNNGGHLIANNSSTVFYYNQPINETKKLDCLYYANYNDNVLKCKALPSISIYNNAKANETKTPIITNTYLQYDKIKKLCVNDDILLAMGCTNTLYYLNLNNIVDNQWIKCDYPLISNTTINYIGINDKLVFMLIYDYNTPSNQNINSNTKLIYTMSNSISSSSSIDWKTWIEKKDINLQNNPFKDRNTLSKFTLNNNILIAFDSINYILWSCPIILNSSSILNNTLWQKYEYKDFSLFSYSITDISIYLNVLYMFAPSNPSNKVLIIPLNKNVSSSSSSSSAGTTNTSSNAGTTNTSSNAGTTNTSSNAGTTNTATTTSKSITYSIPSTYLPSYNKETTNPLQNINSYNPNYHNTNTNTNPNPNHNTKPQPNPIATQLIDDNDMLLNSYPGNNNVYISPINNTDLYNPNNTNTNTNTNINTSTPNKYNNYYTSTNNMQPNMHMQPNTQPNNPYIHNKITSSFFPLVKIS